MAVLVVNVDALIGKCPNIIGALYNFGQILSKSDYKWDVVSVNSYLCSF